jgi:hypothetical protein
MPDVFLKLNLMCEVRHEGKRKRRRQIKTFVHICSLPFSHLCGV